MEALTPEIGLRLWALRREYCTHCEIAWAWAAMCCNQTATYIRRNQRTVERNRIRGGMGIAVNSQCHHFVNKVGISHLVLQVGRLGCSSTKALGRWEMCSGWHHACPVKP